jgi:hypothetical protein
MLAEGLAIHAASLWREHLLQLSLLPVPAARPPTPEQTDALPLARACLREAMEVDERQRTLRAAELLEKATGVAVACGNGRPGEGAGSHLASVRRMSVQEVLGLSFRRLLDGRAEQLTSSLLRL